MFPARSFRVRPRATFAASALAALLLAGCAGAIGDAGQGAPGAGNGDGIGNGGGGDAPTTDPGRVTMHRLNRAEYNNTVRDLFGSALHPADDFTADNRGDAFDNIAEILTLSPVQLEQYQQAAEALSDEALGINRAKLITCDVAADACVRTTLQNLATRAWRRPAQDAELGPYLDLIATAKSQGDGVDVGLKLALQALLISPDFLFRVELDPDPTSLTPHALSPYEIASRLSYFLWSSMPDEALFSAAAAGTLRTPAVLEAQIARMMKDPKAAALVQNFAGQWLYTRLIPDLQPDPTLFPKFDADLRASMRQETELLFRDIAFGGVPASALVNGTFTYVNDRLASHYGLPPVGSTDLKRVDLAANPQRGGFMGQATILAATSHPNATSPVNRGKWILNDLLCTDVPAPPNNVNTMLPPLPAGSTRRQQLEAHKQKACATCHQLMDPLGFGFENYDAVGAYRTMENGQPIDASGNYIDGTPFSGIRQLGTLIAADPKFTACVASKLYTYALGRPPINTPGYMDPFIVDRAAKAFGSGGYQFQSLIQAIVASDTFQKRRGESAGGSP
ncbi:MAG TPA: DUF1592 domain-containing protein [Polyangia bacterium]|nr:DUF1592 domain-containing protein [Polyangia bacterium]